MIRLTVDGNWPSGEETFHSTLYIELWTISILVVIAMLALGILLYVKKRKKHKNDTDKTL